MCYGPYLHYQYIFKNRNVADWLEERNAARDDTKRDFFKLVARIDESQDNGVGLSIIRCMHVKVSLALL